MTEEGVPSLAELSPSATELALAYYEAGLEHGYQLGYRQAEADYDEAGAAFARLVRRAAKDPPYDELCERRGEPAMAERQRDLLRERGLDK